MHPFRMRWTVHSGAILLRWTTHSIYNGIGTFLFLADHLVSIEFNKSGPWQTDPFSHLLFKADIIGNHLVSNPTLLADGLASLKPCSHLTSPFAFASNVKNAFYDKQVMLFIPDVCIFKNLTWKIKEQESIPVGCVPSAFLVGGGSAQPLPPVGRPLPGCRYPLDAGHVTCDACWNTSPPFGQTNICENITIRLRAAKMQTQTLRVNRP